MGSHLEDSSVLPLCKSVKLAGVEVRPLLGSPAPELEDSGIDSDDTNPIRAALTLQLSEESSSDEDVSDKPWVCPHMNPGEPLKDMGGVQESLDVLIQWKGELVHETALEDDLDSRSSPPLYEVELTASDEDDDASVLELVIPMQSRYQRVPTSSPKKTKPNSKCFLTKLLCCIRKN